MWSALYSYLVYCTALYCTLVMVEADVLQPWLLEALAPGQRKQTLVRVQRYQRHNTGNNPPAHSKSCQSAYRQETVMELKKKIKGKV